MIDPVYFDQNNAGVDPAIIEVNLSKETCSINFGNGGKAIIDYNPDLDIVEFYVAVPSGDYQAIGFGETMENTDMIAWFTNTTGCCPPVSTPQQVSLYSLGQQQPMEVSPNIYNTTYVMVPLNSPTKTDFLSTRPTGAPPGANYSIPVNSPFPIIWAWSNTTYVSAHGPNNKGSARITLLKNGGCFMMKQKVFGFVP